MTDISQFQQSRRFVVRFFLWIGIPGLAVAGWMLFRHPATGGRSTLFSTNERGSPISFPVSASNSLPAPAAVQAADGAGLAQTHSRARRPRPSSFQKRAVESQLEAAKRGETEPIKVEPFTPPKFRKPRPSFEPTTEPAPAELEGFRKIEFGLLSAFKFELGSEWVDGSGDPALAARKVRELIPDDVRSLDHVNVAVRGFLIPLRMDEGLAVEFLLVKDQNLCCYGVLPRINEWINVTVLNRGVKPVLDQPVTVCGVLEVGDWRENGFLVSLYRIKAQKVFGP